MFVLMLLLALNPLMAVQVLRRWLVRWLCVGGLRSRPRWIRRRHRRSVELHSMSSQLDMQSQGRRKPDWVRREVLRLAVFLVSCRRTAEAFNRLHGRRARVSHGFVHELCRANRSVLAARRRAMRARLPEPVPRNAVWAMDLTYLRSSDGRPRAVLGLIDHGTRRVLVLKALASKRTLELLGHLLIAIASFDKPAAIRTDNEAMSKSRLWRRALKLLDIRHQRSAPGCPWQNGRIERLFGTLKTAVGDLMFPGRAMTQQVLDEFAGFYNHVRPHSGLRGLTPIEAWHGVSKQDVARRAGQGQWVQALDGKLVAYHLRV